jgi:hypothetical protein
MRVGDWKVEIQVQPGRIAPALFIYRVTPYGKMEFVKKMGEGYVTFETVEEGAAQPFIEMPMEILEAFYMALNRKFLPKSGSHTEGKLEAMTNHLSDLRHMLKLPPAKE